MKYRHMLAAAAIFVMPLWAAPAAKQPMLVEGAPVVKESPRYMLMTGYGYVRATPDTAVIGGGITTRAKKAADALHNNAAAMAKVVAALKSAGIAEQEITTNSFDFTPQYETDSKGNIDPDHTIIAYTVSNRVTVMLKGHLERAGDALDALIANGANESTAINFEIRDREELEMQAREAAGKNAAQRAQIFARTTGAALGPVLTVREGYHTDTGLGDLETVTVSGYRAAAAPPPPATRVAAGEDTIAAVVTVVWALK
jgi:Uncharacterized conserved protein